jgi:hypothetical protein
MQCCCAAAAAAAAAQVVVDGLEPSYLVLRNPLLPAISFEQAEPQEAAAHTAGPNDSPFGHFETLHSSRLMGVSGKDNDKIHARAQVRLRCEAYCCAVNESGGGTLVCCL